MALKSQGALFEVDDGSAVFNAVGEVIDIQGPGGDATEINTTHLSSTAQEFVMGLPDNGTVTLTCNLDPADTDGQVRMRDLRDSQALNPFRITLTDSPASTISFSGYVLGQTVNIATDDRIQTTFNVRVSGAVTWA